MIDGIPMNDMENGAVYWSNWFGLDDITRNIRYNVVSVLQNWHFLP